MATHDKEPTGKLELSRRDFLKAGAAAAVVGAAGADFVFTPSKANAEEVAATYTTTCPYCSAQCGQKVDVAADGTVLDVYGDANSPTSRGGLCAKGAGSYQLVTNPRRLGVPEHTAAVDGYDFTGTAWKRTGNGAWTELSLDTAMTEIATQLVAIRGDLSAQKSVLTLLEVPSGETTVKVDGVDYYGFTNLGVVKAGPGMYYVGTGGVKVDKATFQGYVEGLPGTASDLLASIDDLVWRASSPADKNSWKFLGRSDLKAQVFAQGKIPDSIDVVYDAGTFYAYVATLDMDTLVFTSADMLTWTFGSSIGRPGSYGLVNPSVIKSGSTLKVWHNRLTAPGAYDYKVYYSEYDGSSWTTVSQAVTHDGSQLPMCGHPHVRVDEYDATKYVMTYNTATGIYEATAATSSPTAFSAGAQLHDGAGVIEAAVQAGRAGNKYGLFTEYASGTGYPHEYAFAKVKAYAYTNNSKSVMFFGSSHMNNECNYLYRKIIANFGTSNVEHQARICHASTVVGLGRTFGRGAMSNNWVDLDNSTLFFVIGGNPAENHPASIAHFNHARFDLSNRGRNAGLIVVDPRQTRTARLTGVPYDASNPNDQRKHDRYVRIRPGTNLPFMNGVMKAIIDWMYANRGSNAIADNFFAWHNGTDPNSTWSRNFIADSGATVAVAGWPKYCDSRLLVNAAGDDYQRETRTVGAETISNFPKLAEDIDNPDCVFQKLRQHLASYDTATVADICGCTEADIQAVALALIENSRYASSDFGAETATPEDAGYRAACINYAMGATQFTTAGQALRAYSMLQTLLGNMGRAGGGINAMRGIHNVQGSTDMGVLFDLIPGYSGNPGVGQTYPDYSNKLFGNRVLQTDPNRPTSKSAYAAGDLGLQQRGFYNMTREWFGDRNVTQQTDIDKLWELWPKGNGYQHIEAFRKMIDGTVKAAVVWGQNPAVTEPNQSKVRQGLENLDLLVVVDMFATETAQCSRKLGGVTYLLPACSHVEEAGSVTNSGRWIQWRDRARPPKGNSKADLELLLRFAKALNTAGAFSHIKQQWATMSSVSSLHNGGSGADPWSMLYAKYGWDGTGDFETVSGLDYEGNTLVGSEYVAEQIFKEIASPLDGYSASGAPNGFVKGHMGTVWIYSGLNTTHGGAYNPDQTGNVHPAVFEDGLASGTAVQWEIANRAKSRKGDPKYRGLSLQYPRYGWAWLLNRRIMYNLGELAGDVSDNFVTPTYLSRLFVINTNTLADWSLVYRAFSTLSDKPSVPVGGTSKHSIYAGRFPAHTEPYESPRPDLVAAWGYNTANGASLIFSDTPRGTVDQYPLVLTTFRCVEHFQGGPITRNNPWNVEAEPEPWIEINSVDAIKYGIKDGDYVNVITARSNSTTDEEGRCADGAIAPAPGWAKGFKARVGVGTLANQRVAPGVVAIPWHWGERGLGTGSRANDLTIDAWDANARITEYKVCLCRIEKA